jgi:hypothetical protein
MGRRLKISLLVPAYYGDSYDSSYCDSNYRRDMNVSTVNQNTITYRDVFEATPTEEPPLEGPLKP